MKKKTSLMDAINASNVAHGLPEYLPDQLLDQDEIASGLQVGLKIVFVDVTIAQIKSWTPAERNEVLVWMTSQNLGALHMPDRPACLPPVASG